MSNAAVEHYLSAYQQTNQNVAPWFADQRQLALDIFREQGFPTTRNEKWKYTDIRPFTKCRFSIPEKTDKIISRDQIQTLRFGNFDCNELYFINGHYSAEHSHIKDSKDRMIIEPLSAAADKHADLLRKYIVAENIESDAFTALNTAFLHEGALIVIPDETVLEYPICLYYISTETDTACMSHPHNVIILENNAEATIIENYTCLGDPKNFTNSVTEIFTGSSSRLEHYKIQQESKQAFHISNLVMDIRDNSRVVSHSISLGARLARNDIVANLSRPGAEVTLNGLYMAREQQHVDHHLLVNHLQGHTKSEEYYRGVLNDRGRGVFNGKVIVHKDAQKSDAHQSNANLLLSKHAEVDTKPELEIYADDVKCSHGATVGRLDDEMLFYLRTRAIDEGRAKSLLTFAFAEDVIRRMKLVPVREKLEYQVVGEMPDADLIREFVA